MTDHTRPAVPTPPPLKAAVIMDYQNVHLVGHEAFASSRTLERHESLIDPLKFALELLRVRNAAQGPGYRKATLHSVYAYRGLPSSEYDPVANARSQAQRSHWSRDSRVHVELRPLRYRLERDAYGQPIRDIYGHVNVIEKREKGVDVLCALGLVREAARQDVDLVIMASHDSDLEPALDEATRLGTAKVETCRWHAPGSHVYQLRTQGQRVWCTRLEEPSFLASRDLTPYR